MHLVVVNCQSLTRVYFGPLDKHGQLGIWDARAPAEEVEDEDGDVVSVDNQSEGKCWRLQPHWPATSKSSISAVKFDTTDAHGVRRRHQV